MAWRKKPGKGASEEPEQTATGELEIVGNDDGVVVTGSPGSVEAFLAQLDELAERSGGRSSRVVATGLLAVASDAFAAAKTHHEYVEFSPRAKARLQELGAIPSTEGGGFFRSFVRAGNKLAGNLDWKPVKFGPEQALALQSATAQLALRAAIKEVTAGIERVEDKVDDLVKRVRAERLGAALGDRATLQPLVEWAQRAGAITQTDWLTVASLGPLIARDIEMLRTYLLNEVRDLPDSSRAPTRAQRLERLTRNDIREALALLVVVEDNYAQWQQLRILHTARHEPVAAPTTVHDVRTQLHDLRRRDQALVAAVEHAVDALLAPRGLEGFAPLQKRRLRRHGEALHGALEWFAEQRNLDLSEARAAEYPGLTESLATARARVAKTARSAGETAAEGATRALQAGSRLVRRRDDDPADHEPPLPPWTTD